jgi:methyl-accepting chemotaxis protein
MASPATRPNARRRGTYIVDRELQFAFVFHFVAALALMGALYVAAVYLLPNAVVLEELGADEMRAYLLRSNLVYFVLATALLCGLSILLTHRVAGPARVIEHAVDGIRDGDFSRRLTLRKRDYLKGLAASVAQLSAHVRKREGERLALLRSIDRCLEENDLPAARELLHQLGLPEEAPETEPAKQPE